MGRTQLHPFPELAAVWSTPLPASPSEDGGGTDCFVLPGPDPSDSDDDDLAAAAAAGAAAMRSLAVVRGLRKARTRAVALLGTLAGTGVPKLERLDLSYTSLRGDTAAVATLLRTAPRLAALALVQCGLNQRGSADIIAALPSRLRRLDLSRNAVGVLNACDIARRQARPGGSLEVLELRGCFLCSHGNDARAVHALARALAVGAPLRSLAVDGNCLPKEATLAVAAALRLSRTLVRLSLADNKLWADSAEALGAAAAARCAAGSDVALLLGGCSLRAPEMASLARGTRGPDRRRQRRRRSVSPTVGLRRPPRPGTLGLDLRRNPIGVGAADALRSLLTNAAAPVRALSLAHVPLPAPLLEAICDGIESRSPHLKHLDLDCTALAPLRGTAISSALGAAWAAPGGEGSLPSGRVAAPLLPPLETLSLEACSFGYVGAEAFAALLASVPGHPLKRLNLRRNFVGARGVAALRPVLLADRGLERLVLGRDDLAHPGFGPAALGHGKTVRTRPLAMASRVAVLSSVCCAAADGTQNSLPADVVRGLLDFLDTPVCMSVDDGQHHPA